MMREVLVLGARDGSGNIGDEVINAIAHMDGDWRGVGWHIEQGGHLPPEEDFELYDGMVVALGRALIQPFDRVEDDDLDDVIRANLALPLAAAKAYLRQRAELGGAVVFIGSYAHDHVLSNSVAYCAAKAGLAHATRCLAWDYADQGFSFNIVHPYHVVGTPMDRYVIEAIQETKDVTEQGARAYQAKDLRLKERDGSPRQLTAEEVAGVVAGLVIDPHPWLNGSGLNLYGGTR